MPDWWSSVEAYLVSGRWWSFIQAVLILLAGLLLGRMLASGTARFFNSRLDPHRSMVLRRAVFYAVLGLAVATALGELGFNLGVLLGAAGVLSVALGFASQTSASNLISGLFLVGERPFGIGDVIRVGTTTGEVLSVDLLSVKLRTFDNLFVRIPNETLIKSEVVNLSKFPIRRVDVMVGVAYKEDIGRVRELLLRIADADPLCLEEPKPLFIVIGFGASSVDLQFSVWARRENFLELKNGIYQEIKRAFDEASIEIPFPHTTIYAGSATEPIPIRFVNPPSQGESPL
jgi:small-conductance mechanosensitive channel